MREETPRRMRIGVSPAGTRKPRRACALTRMASACTPGCAVARISESDSNGCAATSRAPRVANERLKRDGEGRVVLQLKSAWRDGTTHIVMSPLEFMQRLAALVPRPRLHLIRFHGVLAPHAGLRAAIVPSPAQSEPADEDAHGAPARMGWARLLCRVFDIDLEHCPQCGGDLKIIAAIEEPAVIVKILTHLGLPARAPPRSPARPLALFQAA